MIRDKFVSHFSEINNINRILLGGKGAGLAEMTRLGLNIPPGFIIKTNAGMDYFNNNKKIDEELNKEILDAIQSLTGPNGEKFNDFHNPLFVSVRSGAPISMPGMMNTILNVGITEALIESITDNDKRLFYRELYWRFLLMFGSAFGVNRDNMQKIQEKVIKKFNVSQPQELSERGFKILSNNLKKEFIKELGKDIVNELDTPKGQLWLAIKGVWNSWDTQAVIDYRDSLGLDENICTAVVVQSMVYGNKGSHSGSGVVYSRDLHTGLKQNPMPGSFLFDIQGEDIVSGDKTSDIDLKDLYEKLPNVYSELYSSVKKLEDYYRKPLDIEFTIQNEKLWLLQVRPAPISDEAAIRYVVDMVNDKLITKYEAVESIRPSLIERLYLPVFSQKSKEKALNNGGLLTKGAPASPGIAVGEVVIKKETAKKYALESKKFILIRDALDPKEHLIMKLSSGIISKRSSVGSHGAIIANVLKKPCIVGCNRIYSIDEEKGEFIIETEDGNKRIIKEGNLVVSIDGTSGEVFTDNLEVIDPKPFNELIQFKKWWDEYDGTKNINGKYSEIEPYEGRPHSPWGNATFSDNPDEIEEYRDNVRKLLTTNMWSTEKARVASVMQFIPKDIRIQQVVVNAEDKNRIQELMFDVLDKGYWNGPRSALGPGAEGASPWQMGIKSKEQIIGYLNEYNFKGVEKAKSGGYPRWMNPDEGAPWQTPPVQIIVMYDPAEKGIEEFEPEHFVCNVTCKSNPDEVVIDINLGTAQLRSFEIISPDQLIRISMELNSRDEFMRGKRTIEFGKNYWKLNLLPHLAAQLDIKAYSDDELEKIISEKIRKGDLPEDLLKELIGERPIKIAKFIEKEVFNKWWIDYKLPFMMRALDEVYSLQVLEIQGRASVDGKINWFLIYDAKGRDERKTVEIAEKND